MERAWIIVSILCLVVAGILLLREYQNAAFVSATLGAVAWFLSYRVKLRSTIVEPVEATRDENDASEDQDEK
jgi:F0F1-type ATP synthase assembly protein I